MNTFYSLLPYIELALAILLIVLILIQRSGNALSGAFGGGDNFSSAFHTRRGFEKNVFNLTIIVSILFVASTLANIFK